MRDSHVVRRIPGTDLRPGDLVGRTPAGPIMVRDLSPLDLAALRGHPECLEALPPVALAPKTRTLRLVD